MVTATATTTAAATGTSSNRNQEESTTMTAPTGSIRASVFSRDHETNVLCFYRDGAKFATCLYDYSTTSLKWNENELGGMRQGSAKKLVSYL